MLLKQQQAITCKDAINISPQLVSFLFCVTEVEIQFHGLRVLLEPHSFTLLSKASSPFWTSPLASRWKLHWIFWVGSGLGGATAALTHQLIYAQVGTLNAFALHNSTDKKQPKLYISQISTDDSLYFHRQCPSDVTITFHSITSSRATDRCDKNRSFLNLSHFFPKLSTLDLAVAVAASPGFQLRYTLTLIIAVYCEGSY